MKKLLIANRGEIACRISAAAVRHNMRTVAVYSEADANALHVELADEAFAIGPAPARESYLVQEKILAAAATSGADAIHPGYGFLSENASFAQAVEDAGFVWVGPTPQSIEDMGDKAKARGIAQSAGVPVVSGSEPVSADDPEGLRRIAESVGYPLLVKAAAGGGGIGMRRVDNPEKLAEVVTATQSMAGKAFANDTVFLERYIEHARHIEVQVFGDGNGDAMHLGERDCSLQRRFQKIIEESPAPGLPDTVRTNMCEAAVRLARAQNYRGAGTVEFIVDAKNFEFFFLEMNTRIQVEHPVTEMCAGVDLVGMQLALARGGLVPLETPTPEGHALECRLYAENPKKRFLPSPGDLELLEFPTGMADIRIDTGYRQGDTISFHYDPLIAKLVTHGETREAAIDRMLALIRSIELQGPATNLEFLALAIDHRAFRQGNVTTAFVDDHQKNLIKLL